ncbi:MAG TPA: sugar phosphate isomerase/epimerase [Acidimicrobiia bacterium]|jgi:sugar phosphate isomerase/epimerase
MTALGMCTATLLREPLGDASNDDLRATVDAAVAAGCRDLSIWAHHLESIGDVRTSGARLAALEAATAWAGGDRDAAAAEAQHLATLAAEHGAATIAAVTLDPTVDDLDRARDHLALLVAGAEEAGATVCVEFLPWSGIPTLAVAWDLVEPLGPRAGILLDTWHWQRQPGGPCPDLLGTIPGDRIHYVQLCDAAAAPSGDSFEEAMTARLLPGDGVVDFGDVLAVLDRIGAQPYVATEIFNTALVADLGSAGAARAMAAAARSLDARFPSG